MSRKDKVLGNSLADLNKLILKKNEVKEVDYANAPYNFIEFPDKVVYRYDDIDKLPKHNIFCENLKTGYIEFEFENETPLYIGSGIEGIQFEVNGTPKIPGSTMRGLVRSNCEILSHSYPDFVEDRKFLFRQMAGSGIVRTQYNLKLNETGGFNISDKVDAGYIVKEGGEYYIYPAKTQFGKSFRLIDEFFLREKSIPETVKYIYKKTCDDLVKIEKQIEEINENIKEILSEKSKDEIEIEIEKKEKLKESLMKMYSGFNKEYQKSKDKDILGSKLIEGYCNKIENSLLKKVFRKKVKRRVEQERVTKIYSDFVFEYKSKRKKEKAEPNFEKKLLRLRVTNKAQIEELLKQKVEKRKAKEKEWRKFLGRNQKPSTKCYQTKENIEYSLRTNGGIEDIGSHLKVENKGVLFNCNEMNGKRKHYFIFDQIKDLKHSIDDSLINEYKRDNENKLFLNKIFNERELQKEVACSRRGYYDKISKVLELSEEEYNEMKKEFRKENYEKKKFDEKVDIIRKFLNKNIRKFYSLPEEGEEAKVIFYKLDDDGNVKCFGRNPFLRMFYDYSIEEILEKNIRTEEGKIDFTEAIFGFTNKKNVKEKISYKGRVSFEDVKVSSYSYKSREEELTLSNPKATSFQLYLVQEKNDIKKLSTYNNKNAKLRGQKFYWLREKEIKDSSNNSMKTKILPIEKGAKFQGKIYFENFTKEELGLLLISLNYDKETKETIGMGKPYGYGRVKFEDIKIYIEDKKKSFLNFENIEKEKLSVKDIKDRYIDWIEEKMDEKFIDNKSIIDYLISKRLVVDKSKNDKIKYMKMKEFSNRNILKNIKNQSEELK